MGKKTQTNGIDTTQKKKKTVERASIHRQIQENKGGKQFKGDVLDLFATKYR